MTLFAKNFYFEVNSHIIYVQIACRVQIVIKMVIKKANIIRPLSYVADTVIPLAPFGSVIHPVCICTSFLVVVAQYARMGLVVRVAIKCILGNRAFFFGDRCRITLYSFLQSVRA